MRILTSLTATGLTVVALAAGTATEAGVAAASAAPTRGSAPEVVDLQRMRDAMPAGMQRLHDQMMTGPASRGMLQMMSTTAPR